VNTDFHSTFCDLAGAKVPTDLDGISIAPLLTGKGELPARSLYWHFPHYTNQGSQPAGAMRKGDWKLIAHYASGQVELFDLAKDPSESNDVAATNVDFTAKLHDELTAWREKAGVQLNKPNPDYDKAAGEAIYKAFDTSNMPRAAQAVELFEKYRPWRKLMDEAIRK